MINDYLPKFISLLKSKIGLDINTVGEATLNKILKSRMGQCEVTDIGRYYQKICTDNNELSRFLEAAVVPETWFFRDDKPYAIILEKIRNSRNSDPAKTFKILSIPSSTGEEPYSLVMFLLRNNIPESLFKITACDISPGSLQVAKQGIYDRNSFRGKIDKEYLDAYFSFKDEQLIISETIINNVDFFEKNILNKQTLGFNSRFDIILCRNLLIYFDTSTKATAFNNLHGLLEDTGTLFIGHSEYGSVPKDIFSIGTKDTAFSIVKNNTHNTSSHINAATTPITINKADSVTAVKRPFLNQKHDDTDAQAALKNNAIKNPLISNIRALADNGKLDTAEELCRAIIDGNNADYEVYFLMGLVKEASNNLAQAELMFRKALYLQPKHYESLVHLSLISKKSGNDKSADLLMQRAQRALTETK